MAGKQSAELKIEALIATAKKKSESLKSSIEDEGKAKLAFDNADEKGKEAAKGVLEKASEKVKAARVELEKAKVLAAQGGNGKFVPKQTEVGFFHVELSKPLFDTKTGKPLNKPFVQIFEPKAYTNFMNQRGTLGYTVKTLWNPKTYASI